MESINNNYWISISIEKTENCILNNKQISFRIFKIINKGIQVKVFGLYAYIPFKHTFWIYSRIEFWHIIFPYLTDKYFIGVVKELKKSPLKIKIDAKIQQFKKTELVKGQVYLAIVLNKTESNLLLEIGYNFNWEYGSILGYFHSPDFVISDFINESEIGQTIAVTFTGENKYGQLIFTKSTDLDFWQSEESEKYIDKFVKVKFTRKLKNYYFWIENKYRAILDVKKSNNGKPDNFITNKLAELKDNDLINCKITHKNSYLGFFYIKWIINNDEEIDWFSDEVLQLSGKTIEAKVIKNKIQNVKCLISDKYEALLPVEYLIYKEDITDISYKIKQLKKNDIILCEIISVNQEYGFYVVKYLKTLIKDRIEKKELIKLAGKIVNVKVSINQQHEISFIVEDKYLANLPLSFDIYPFDLDKIKSLYALLNNNDFIVCRVIGYDFKTDRLILKWIINNIFINNKDFEEAKNLVGKIVKIKYETNKYTYLINNKFNAIFQLSSEYSFNKTVLYNSSINQFNNNDVIYCKIESIDEDYGFLVLKSVFSDEESINWNTPQIKSFIGQTVTVNVLKNDNKLSFLINNIFPAILPVNSSVYPENELEKVNYDIKSFNNNSKIICTITGIDHLYKAFTLKWIRKDKPKKVKTNIDRILNDKNSNKLKNILDEDLYKKLKAIANNTDK